MTKDEIKTLIAEKISGQGNQVDIGGVLAEILNELVDASAPAYNVNDFIPEGANFGLIDDEKAEILLKNADKLFCELHDSYILFRCSTPADINNDAQTAIASAAASHDWSNASYKAIWASVEWENDGSMSGAYFAVLLHSVDGYAIMLTDF